MKKKIALIATLSIAFFVFAKVNSNQVEKAFSTINKKIEQSVQDGDIIFQTSQSKQCEAVRIATNSKFSHCGIIYEIKGEKYVFEAVQPVKTTLLSEWIKHGEGNKYLVKRLKNSSKILTPEVISKMKNYGKQFDKKDYDLYFEWTDDKIYCSELVWKIYKNGAGIELCSLEKLKSFNLADEKVKKILKERYGNKIPLEEKVVAPSQLVNSTFLETIIDTY
ncbi:YiiX family permuted papain-like enzyme [Flavobacterium sp. j3]|uniref:YiiX family permuted papain-like enzyme n=1 Tax=Flavobacterium aureirubrum TaxID=3133147 RepID=A0ABU9N0A3_9FLAO